MVSELLPEKVSNYLDALVPPRQPEMARMENFAKETDFPIIGPASGYLCYQVARMIGAKRIFELGSGYGYSTAWFARAVKENGGGQVFHVVWDEGLSKDARQHLGSLGLADSVTFMVSEAVQALKQTEGPFDLIFNDIDKQAYPESLPVIASKLRRGGVLLVDNTLWSGRILNEGDHSPATEAIRKFNRAVTTDPAWIASIVPIRDGVMVAYKV
jgi:caffeoyl-CoA O-methyltransferase